MADGGKKKVFWKELSDPNILKEGVHQFYKFVLKCKVRYTDTAVICDFPQIC